MPSPRRDMFPFLPGLERFPFSGSSLNSEPGFDSDMETGHNESIVRCVFTIVGSCLIQQYITDPDVLLPYNLLLTSTHQSASVIIGLTHALLTHTLHVSCSAELTLLVVSACLGTLGGLGFGALSAVSLVAGLTGAQVGAGHVNALGMTVTGVAGLDGAFVDVFGRRKLNEIK